MIRAGLLFAMAFAAGAVHAQEKWAVGFGVAYSGYVNNPGINMSLTARLPYDIFMGPDFSAFLNSERSEQGRLVKRKEIEANFTIHKRITLGPRITGYPLAGLNFARITSHPLGEEPDKRSLVTVNLGAGVEWELKRITLYAEGKYVRSPKRVDISIGLTVPIFTHGTVD